MELGVFDYNLSKDLIAQKPAEKRDASRLLVVSREHNHFIDSKFARLPQYITKNDLLVINDSKVSPVKFQGFKENGKMITILLTKEFKKNNWAFLAKKPKSLKQGENIHFNNGHYGTISGWYDKSHRVISFNPGVFEKIIVNYGLAPLPPYIKRKNPKKTRNFDLKRYQTIYAQKGISIAAPTAGLHFTKKILEQIKNKGVEIAKVTLNVGEATFQPVRTKNVEDHKMMKESYEINAQQAEKINKAIKDKKRIIAVGTTSVRALESSYSNGKINKANCSTDLFIYPGYKFKVVKGIITNFHLPKSTLLMLVSAFAGIKKIKAAYQYAKKSKYRFYSYGDSMLIL